MRLNPRVVLPVLALTLQLAVRGLLEPLGGALVGLHLGHVVVLRTKRRDDGNRCCRERAGAPSLAR